MKGQTVVLGVAGSIAAYKAAEITRELIKKGLQVRVVMTESATHFITPLTFETLTQHKVFSSIFGEEAAKIPYLTLSHEADVILVAPATATILAKAACGLANDILAATILSATCPIIFAPAMHSEMYSSPATQENIAILKRRGHLIIGPETGELARGGEGMGRLAAVGKIVEAVTQELSRLEDLKGKKVLVTGGATQEFLDPVRFFGSSSSGKMGYALAEEARRRGAQTVLVSGPVTLSPPQGVEFVSVKSALEMREAVLKHFPQSEVVIMSAAVSDFRPAAYSRQKIKKGKRLTVEFEENPDILEELGNQKRVKGDYRLPLLVGFAAESENLLANAREKLEKKNLDLVVANDITKEESGFGQNSLEFTLVDREGKSQNFPLISKPQAARIILDKVVTFFKKKS